MTEVEIATPRGVTLRGTFVDPVDSTDAAVVFSHALLFDRTSTEHFDRLAAVYRSMGYATLVFDHSGHGLSDDDVITTELRAQDLRAVSGWLEKKGFTHQLLHAHSSGATAALSARAPAVRALLLTSAMLGPADFDWQAIFSDAQLRQLESEGRLEITDDSDGPRKSFTFTSQTLIDLSLNDAKELLDGVNVPIALIFDQEDVDRGLVDVACEALDLLPDESRVEIVRDTYFSDPANLAPLATYAKEWAQTHLPIERGKKRDKA